MEHGISKNQIISVLTKSPHGKLSEYTAITKAAAELEAEFLAHLIAWNHRNGQIRDAKVAIPVASLSIPSFDGELADNSLAHIALLDPRNLVRAVRFGKEVKTPGHSRAILRLVEEYLRAREAKTPWWDKTALQHRESMKTLYALCHVKPCARADRILFKGEYPSNSVFSDLKGLKNLTALEAASIITQRKIPFLVAIGALGARAKETDTVLALIEQMTPAELITNTKMLERLGIKTVPALRAAYEAKLSKAADSKKGTFKTTRAAEAVTDERLKDKLRGAQEKQLNKLGGIEGNWLVLGDKSGSMQSAIESARMVSATLARMVKGKVHLVFFDTAPRYIDATGKEYDTLLDETKRVTAQGGTSIGCGLVYAFDRGLDVDGIAVVSDGAENNSPLFAQVYTAYCKKFDKTPTVYLYWVPGHGPQGWGNDPNAFPAMMQQAGHDLQVFDLRGGLDYFSLPNLVQTMRAQRYSLVDEIMEVPLLTTKEIFNNARQTERS